MPATKVQFEGHVKAASVATEGGTCETDAVVRKPVRKAATAHKDVPDDELLWQAFWSIGSVVVRNQLVEMYLHLVDAVVRRMPYDTLRHWGVDDLKDFGLKG